MTEFEAQVCLIEFLVFFREETLQSPADAIRIIQPDNTWKSQASTAAQAMLIFVLAAEPSEYRGEGP